MCPSEHPLVTVFNDRIRAFLGEKPEGPIERLLRAFPGSTIIPQGGYARWYLRRGKSLS